MRERIILDTGPLVAWLDKFDQWHNEAVRLSLGLHPPFLTCEPVPTEACFLLQHLPGAIEQIGRWLERGQIRVALSLDHEWEGVFRLLAKYHAQPMSLADACLVAMVAGGIGDRVFTLDEHFLLYRHSGRRVVPVLLPGRG